MVLGYATNHLVNGVIACGAFAGAEQLATIKCPVMGIVGMDDFNFSETAQYILNPERAPANAFVELTKASHAWPDEKVLADAFGWFRLSDTKHGEKREYNNQVKSYVKIQQVRIDSLVRADDLLQAACVGRNMASVPVYEKQGDFDAENAELVSRNSYKEQQTQLIKSLRFEMKVRDAYNKALLEKDAKWWTREILSLHEKMETEPNVMLRMAYQRISGFLGIICYSYCNQFIARKQVSQLEQTLMVYRLAEPENQDMLRFSEMLGQLKN